MLVVILAVVVVSAFGYGQYVRSQKSIVVLATTTSTYDSGLLDYLMPQFESKYNIEVHIISVGTGQAIETAKRGDADLVLVHSQKLELEFINSTYGVHRVGVMYNDFIIIGPINDHAGIKDLTNATEAFKRIADRGAEGNALFVSRADKSGTNMLELSIWSKLGMAPSNKTQAWYLEAGASMGTVLRMSNEKGAYTLTDRATWLSFQSQLANMAVLVQSDKILLNPYAVILVNPEKYPQRNYKGALTLAKFMISEEGQNLIAGFTKEGQTLFTPIARNLEKAKNLGFPDQERELSWYDTQTLESLQAGSMMKNSLFEALLHVLQLIFSLYPEIWNITLLSLRVSGTAVLIGALIGVPIGTVLGLGRFRGKHSLMYFIDITLRSIVFTFMGLPPVVVGLVVYLLLSASGPLGPLGLLYTPTAMIITQLILVVPIITGVTMSAVGSVEKAVREKALSLGATDRQAAWMVLREARMGLLTAIIVAFGAAISEVGGILITGGNIRWFTRTLTTAIVQEVNLGEFNKAIILGVILLSMAFAINLALTIIQLRGAKR